MNKIQKFGDTLAVILSSLCVVHCIVLPVLLIVLPSLGGLLAFNDETFHRMLLVFIIPVGVVALSVGLRHHQNWGVYVCGLLGLTMLAGAALLGHHLIGHAGETALTVFASVFIVFAHLQNFRLGRRRSLLATR